MVIYIDEIDVIQEREESMFGSGHTIYLRQNIHFLNADQGTQAQWKFMLSYITQFHYSNAYCSCFALFEHSLDLNVFKFCPLVSIAKGTIQARDR